MNNKKNNRTEKSNLLPSSLRRAVRYFHKDHAMSDNMRQARKFIDYLHRDGDPKRWWDSKDFTPETKTAIESELRSMIEGGMNAKA